MTKQTVVFDLEAISHLEAQWSQNLFQKVITGFNPKEMIIMGRQTGKSMYYNKTVWAGSNLCKEIVMPLKPKSKYQFSRAKWYTANLDDDSDVYWRLGSEYNNIIAWCNETFGPHPRNCDAWSRWWVGIGLIYFRDEQDLVMFKLKWS